MQIPFVGFQPTFTSEHMAALGIFGLLQIVSFVYFIKTIFSDKDFKILFKGLMVAISVLSVSVLVGLSFSGTIAPWTGRFYSLWDTGFFVLF